MTKPHSTDEISSLPAGVTLTTLDNGLTIIVREDHSAPVVSAQAWAMAGSIHEGRWLGAGLSHVLEHMLFKGTTTRPGSRIDQEVQEAGGYMNAYTSFDRTVYHIDVPNTGARTAIDILCDIMQNATLPPDELAKEMDVIRREMDMGQDDPGRRASRRLFEVAYTKSPYRFTIIGYPDIFNEVKPDDIRGYYREKYAPNNVFYVVAGDVKNDGRGGANQNGLRKKQSARDCRRWFCRPNRNRPRRAKSSRKRRLNSAISISRGTSLKCAIPTCRCWTCSPCCSAAAAVRACSSRSVSGRVSCITWTRGLTAPACPACSA